MSNSDSNNFSSSSPHRLPTVSASQALQDLGSTPRRPLSTGLRNLDAVLQGRDYDLASQDNFPGGVSRGEVTEIYGPPGVGKTAIALQVAANVLRSGGSVVWVDTSYQIVGSRLRNLLHGFQGSLRRPTADPEPVNDLNTGIENFTHYKASTLPHLLALLTHQSSSFPPSGTSLIVVDSVSTLFALAFPKTSENADSQQTFAKKNDAAQWASGRRWAVMGDFVTKVGTFAETKNIALLLTSQTSTRIRSETGAVLTPAISGTAWDTGVRTRVVLFRDWVFQTAEGPSSQGEYLPGVRFAGVVKAKGVGYEGVGKVVTFRIEEHGIQELKAGQADIRRDAPPIYSAMSLKRKRGEIADSQFEDEEAAASDQEFGWAADDMTLNAEELFD